MPAGRPQVHYVNESRVIAALKDPITTRAGKLLIGHTATKHNLNPAEEKLLKELAQERQVPPRKREYVKAPQLPLTGKKFKDGAALVCALLCTATNRAFVFQTSKPKSYLKLINYFVRHPDARVNSNFLYHIPEFRLDATTHGSDSFVIEVLEVQAPGTKLNSQPESMDRRQLTAKWEEKLARRGLSFYRRDRQRYRSYERSPDPVVARLGKEHAEARKAWEDFQGTYWQAQLAEVRVGRAQTADALRRRAITTEEARKINSAISVKWHELQAERDRLYDRFVSTRQALASQVNRSLGG